jgi:hypothetical protein
MKYNLFSASLLWTLMAEEREREREREREKREKERVCTII